MPYERLLQKKLFLQLNINEQLIIIIGQLCPWKANMTPGEDDIIIILRRSRVIRSSSSQRHNQAL